MKIATITIFCNERFRVDNWLKYYSEYKDEIALHVIVNNGNFEDCEFLQSKFPDSVVLYSSSKNLLAAYNIGLLEIMKHKEIDAICQITNDIQLSTKGFTELYKFLYSNERYAMVSPILYNKDCDVVCQFGSTVSLKNMSYKHIYQGLRGRDIKENVKIVTGLPGGIVMAKRNIYEKVGIQDEQIFMYGDETDMSIKVMQEGYLMAVTKEVSSWHQHINLPGKRMRNPNAALFMARNHIYIARKHFGFKVIVQTVLHELKKFCFYFGGCILHLRSKEEFIYFLHYLKGIWRGICNNMNNDFIR
ncbi:MAG: glycosyltransferase family 2 protein [Flavobacteriales bacterium]|nr:glycosyltransferase family 2 protein [Flavobacteriales bacterium]